MRPVLPMVMRGLPVTRKKGSYIFKDVAREARANGVSFGNFYDPIGKPVRTATRCSDGLKKITDLMNYCLISYQLPLRWELI